ncbi:MAG: pitrilysin family protein [Vicinamibacterales bacterium]|nr:pitrilysin family protein [Vicinamibacterales bacterium]MDP6610134.1 pitrilysin family protein [Vicinamibacterales bacterium]HAK56917.1 hypothetical protein [Acidobacteriota bacterium]
MRVRPPVVVLVGTLVAVATGGAWAQAGGQQTQSITGAEVKGLAPVSDEILQVELPKAEEAVLDNGLHLMVLEDRRVPTVSFQVILIGAGGYYDPPDHAGLAGFTASLLREGTTTRSSVEIAEALETLASRLNASTDMSLQAASLNGSSLTEHLDETMALAADVLLHPSFPEEELALFKDRERAGLIQERTRPGFLAVERLAKVIYGEHPAGRVSPTPESLDKTTREDLRAFHQAYYVPDHAVVALAGDISMADARVAVERHFGDWANTGTPQPTVEDPPPIAAARVYLINRDASVQTNLVVGTQAINRTSSDYDVLTVMNQIIGGGATGRLFLNLREDKGYTYGAYSSFTALRYRGDWDASTEVRTEVTGDALAELLRELERIRDEPVPNQEFQDAKRNIVAGFALSLESPGTLLGSSVVRHLYDLPDDHWDRYPERIMAVTREQVQTVAARYLDAERLHIVAVGDGAQITDALTSFGAVDVYDDQGTLIETRGAGQ